MNLFQNVKYGVSCPEAAERYGLTVRRGSMACCPFHDDRTPSMKLYPDHFHCFGCGRTGDVINLASRLTGLSALDAAQRLAADFGIDTDRPPTKEILKKCRQKTEAQQLMENERLCFSVLTEYLHLLQGWKERYAPKTPEEPLDDRFVEACQIECRIEYLCDVFISGSAEQRIAAVRELADTGRIQQLQEYTGRKRREEQQHERSAKHDYDLAV